MSSPGIEIRAAASLAFGIAVFLSLCWFAAVLSPEDVGEPVAPGFPLAIALADARLDFEAGEDVLDQLIDGELGQAGDLVAEALAQSSLGFFEQELSECLFGGRLCFAVEDLGHLELQKAGVGADWLVVPVAAVVVPFVAVPVRSLFVVAAVVPAVAIVPIVPAILHGNSLLVTAEP